MELKDFWQKRQKRSSRKMLSYLKYVFNDHFILFLFILFGGLIYLYSNLIKSLNTDYRWPLILSVVLIALTPFFGRLATSLTAADQIFLSPMEDEFGLLVQKARRRSYVLPGLFLAGVAAIASPLLVAYGQMTFRQAWMLWLLLALFKLGQFFIQELQFKKWQNDWSKQVNILNYGIYLLVVALFVYFSKMIALILAAIYALAVFVYYRREMRQGTWNWALMIQRDQDQLATQLNLINLFTDVPEVKSQVKRKSVLDPLLQAFPRRDSDPAIYSLSRTFIRQADYMNLYLRLTVVALVFIILPGPDWLSLAIGLLFLYLIGFQLIPLAFHNKKPSLDAIIPISDALRIEASQSILWRLLLFTSILFILVFFLTTFNLTYTLIGIVAYLVFSWTFTHFYMPNRLKAKGKKR